MKILLDTCTFLWLISGDSSLPPKMLSLIVNPENNVYLSVISIWEAVLKNSLGRLPLPESAGTYLTKQRERHGLEALPLDEASVLHLVKLPNVHRDPFDRMMICQAMEHGLSFATPDSAIAAYPIKTLWGE